MTAIAFTPSEKLDLLQALACMDAMGLVTEEDREKFNALKEKIIGNY